MTNSTFLSNEAIYTYGNKRFGGAIFFSGTENTITIEDSTFESNGEMADAGGALYIKSEGNISIKNTEFLSNNAEEGAALYINNSNIESITTIDNTTFKSNGAPNYNYRGSAIYFENSGNATINNSKFIENQAYDGTVYYYNKNLDTQFTIQNTLFEKNGYKKGYEPSYSGGVYTDTNSTIAIINSTFNSNIGCYGGALTLNANNVTIQDSNFTGNGIHFEETEGGAVRYYANMNDSSVNITNSVFDSNIGTAAIALNLNIDSYHSIDITPAKVSITNTNFTKNLLPRGLGEVECSGLVIYSCHDLYINNSNFIENGLPENITLDDLGEDREYEGGLIYQDNANLTIDNSNFTDNRAIGESGGIINYHAADGVRDYSSDKTTYTYSSNETLTINNTLFKDNTIVPGGERSEIMCRGPVVCISGNAVIDNTQFINNKLNILEDVTESTDYMVTGVICRDYENSSLGSYYYIYNLNANITNCVFYDNSPANFIIRDNEIVLNDSDYEEFMFDGYMPNYGDVVIFLDENETGTPYKLDSILNDDQISKVYVNDFKVNEDNYLIKMVVNQTEGSKYYDKQYYHNNTYYFLLPHEYILSVNATSPIKIGDNTTITGKVYYLNSTGGEVTFKNKPVSLYINDTYIATTNTDENGEYEFNYTCDVIGTQNVTVAFNETLYLPKLVNNTTFDVIQRESVLIVNATNNTLGELTKITFTLTDTDGNPLNNSFINFYVNDKYANGTTNEQGVFEYTCKIPTAGDKSVVAIFDGDYGHKNAFNSTIFEIYKLNTTITVTAQNTTLGEEITIKGKLVDQNNKSIKNTEIILLINNEEVKLNTTSTGEFSYDYTAVHPNENYVEVFYEGNKNYTDSLNSTIFMVNRINTTTTAKSVSNVSGNVVLEVTVMGKDGKTVTNGTLIVLNENGEIIGGHEINSKTTKITLTNLFSGAPTLTICYEGDNTYNPSNTTQKVKIIPESKILIEVLNNTEGNVVIEYTVTDKNDTILKQQETTITLPNGSTTTAKTDNNGKIVLTDKTVKAGNRTTTAKIETTDKIIGTTTTKNITVVPDYQKIIDEQAKTIKEQDKKINDLENIIDTKNKTTTIKVIPQEGTVDDTSISVSLDTKLGEPIANAPVTVKNSAGEIIGKGTTNKDGVVNIPVATKAGTEKITVTYPGDKNHKAAKKTVKITTVKNKVLVTVDPVNGIIGENIRLTAHITDTNGKAVSGGNLVFKLNGKTLRTDGSFNSTAPAWKFKVNKGKVTIIIKADLYLRNAKNLTASYSGTYKYEEAKSSVVTAQIKKRNAQLTVTATPTKQKQYKTITFTSTVKDTTPNTKNKTAINQGNYVIFKINGKTIKDDNDENLKVKVKNGKATYKYTVPQGMGGIDKNGATRNYEASCVLVSETFYPDTRNLTFFNVERSPVTININKVSVNSKNMLSVQASIRDYKNKKVIGTNQLNIKINGKSYVNPKTGKSQNFQVINGTVNLKNLQLSKDIIVKKITLVTGARQAYLGQRNETTNIVKV